MLSHLPLPDFTRGWREAMNHPCYRWTFIEAFWWPPPPLVINTTSTVASRWGLMTITTVGYDLNPRTLFGRPVRQLLELHQAKVTCYPSLKILYSHRKHHSTISANCCIIIWRKKCYFLEREKINNWFCKQKSFFLCVSGRLIDAWKHTKTLFSTLVYKKKLPHSQKTTYFII